MVDAQAKWERKTANAGAKWKAMVEGKGQEYAEGLSRSLEGASVGPMTRAAWEEGIRETSAEDFQRSIAGKGRKYIENLKRAIAL